MVVLRNQCLGSYYSVRPIEVETKPKRPSSRRASPRKRRHSTWKLQAYPKQAFCDTFCDLGKDSRPCSRMGGDSGAIPCLEVAKPQRTEGTIHKVCHTTSGPDFEDPVSRYLRETAPPTESVETLPEKAGGAMGILGKSRDRLSKQCARICTASGGRLLKGTRYNTTLPGQVSSADMCLQSPLSDVLELIPEEFRPSPSRVMEWMAERRLRPHEACAELLLLSGEDPIFPKLRDLIAAQPHAEATRRSPLVQQMDPEIRELDVNVWMSQLQNAIGSVKVPAEEPDIRQSSSMLDALSSVAKNSALRWMTGTKGNSKPIEIDIRWLGAAVLCFPLTLEASFKGNGFGRGLKAACLWQDLQILNFSDSALLCDDHFKVLAGKCPKLHWLEVTRCPELRTMEALKDIKNLQTVIAHECSGFKAPQPLLTSDSVRFLELRQCAKLKVPNLELPLIEQLDLSGLKSLQSLNGFLPNLSFLDLSSCPLLKAIDEVVFQSCPVLRELDVRDCPRLRSINGLATATELAIIRAGRCTQLVSLGAQEAHTIELVNSGIKAFGALRFLDVYGCDILPVEEIWALFVNTWSAKTSAQTEELRHILGSASAPSIQCTSVRGDEAPSITCEVCESECGKSCSRLTKPTLFKSGSTFELVATVQKLEDRDGLASVGCAFVCWPERQLHEVLSSDLLSGDRKQLELSHVGACRTKFKEAVDSMKFSSVEVTKVSKRGMLQNPEIRTKVRMAPKWKLEETKNELLDAQAALGEIDLDLLRAGVPTILSVMPDREVPCCFGCGQWMQVQQLAGHEARSCSSRLVPCRRGCGKMVKLCHREHHEQIESALQDRLQTWNAAKLRIAIQQGRDHCCAPECRWRQICTGCKLPAKVIESAEKYLSELEVKVKAVKPVVAKGRVSIDFDNCLVGIAASIAFCARKPPDASAEFESREAALEIIVDLATVIMAFGTPVVIEGHTGQVDPPEYWGSLAANRASLICNELKRCGVRADLIRAKGCPGGGAKVLILPDKTKTQP
eukprot:gnl/MRDRNA2_/MRDRNA2_142434_c0_seq1.p1 gnl/MRDRNA2_/MRDRNA2_142434_c0~~gnl/MRDRNA2_/MRDRNA2_142434_c0_seq1.p1  ORF type:complete len:1018 (+),score=152.87 gnl/MRDRNA2_/MRDRNA2_142434_c0_seq1:87-3140(+)